MASTQQSLDIGHPAPHRRNAHPIALSFSLFGAPAAWMVQLLAGFATTSYLCYTGEVPGLPAAAPGWLQPAVTAVNIIALLVGVAALVIGLGLLRRTANEHQDRSGGVVDAGEGRTRFLAIWGVFIGAMFLVAVGVNVFSLFMVPLCRP